MGARMNADYLNDLNPPQREAVEHGDGPLLVLAGAGSGKTRVITYRIAHLIHEMGIKPWNILAVTFTNKAAGEMKQRVNQLLDDAGAMVHLGTFHSIGARFLRQHVSLIGYDRNFTIYDGNDQVSLMKTILKRLGYDRTSIAPRQMLGAISSLKQKMEGPETLADWKGFDPFKKALTLAYPAYQESLKRNNAVDFDDLLVLPVRLLQEFPELRNQYNDRWRYLLVDEYQDTNLVQYKWLKLLTSNHDNICVVGDDDQAIYRWRGADVRNILQFERDFPGTQVVKLERNYRSTGHILETAHQVVTKVKGRKEKKLWTEAEKGDKPVVFQAPTERREAIWVVEHLRKMMREHGYQRSDCAVFYRTNAQSRVLEEQFRANGIPYTIVGGVRFYERKEIKDALAYLRILLNPADDISALRIINVPPRGIGKITIEKIQQAAVDEGIPFLDAVVNEAKEPRSIGRNSATRLQRFVELYAGLLEASKTLPLDELLKKVLDDSGYWDMLSKDGSEEAQDRSTNLAELINEVAEFVVSHEEEEASLDAFLERVSLVSDLDDLDEKEDRVPLMTLHSAKGLEFNVVFLTGLEQDILPHSRALDDEGGMDEERRLCYVGMTRARQRLFLTLASSRMVFGSTRTSEPSDFLKDIEPDLLDVQTPKPPRSRLKGMSFEEFTQSTGGYAKAKAPKGTQAPRKALTSAEPDFEEVFDADSGEILAQFRPGVKVFHRSFGVGKIVQVEGAGQSAKCTVVFPGTPMKKIVAKFLQVIS